MVLKIEVCTRVNAFQFLESHREIELDITRRVCVMRKIKMIVVTIVLSSKTQCLMPPHSFFFPELVPFHFFAGFDEELHLHLFKFPHTEDELSCDDLIPECFTYLGDSKRYLHPSCFLHIKKVDKNPLSRFRPQINLVCLLGD